MDGVQGLTSVGPLAHNEKLPITLADAKAVGSQLTVVAGIRFELMTFRL